jgi:beta-lactamase regulating signal transducer with metallopeptidase domain
LRRPVRALFGAEIAYLLWLLPLAAGFAVLLPARAAEPGAAATRRFICRAITPRCWAASGSPAPSSPSAC